MFIHLLRLEIWNLNLKDKNIKIRKQLADTNLNLPGSSSREGGLRQRGRVSYADRWIVLPLQAVSHFDQLWVSLHQESSLQTKTRMQY